MNSATIKLFLAGGDAKGLRTAEIVNWTGFAIAAPRTELDQLLQRDELDKSGIYILTGTDPLSGSPRAYIGEAEVIRDRLKQHKTKEFWISAIVFVSKDENLTKAHVAQGHGVRLFFLDFLASCGYRFRKLSPAPLLQLNSTARRSPIGRHPPTRQT